MSEMPAWALSFSYWLHMLATVIWIGGLGAVSLLLIPAARQLADVQQQAALLEKAQRRLDPLAWFSLILLVGTGMMQMAASPSYDGLLAINNAWAVAILVKHLAFFGMAGLSAAITWGTLPSLRRAILRQSRGKDAPELENLQNRNLLLLRLNLLLGLAVLAFTAWARVAG